MSHHQKKYSFIALVISMGVTALIVGGAAYMIAMEELGVITSSIADTNQRSAQVQKKMVEKETETDIMADADTHTNTEYSFSFNYPSAYQVKTYTDKTLTIGSITGSGLDEIVDSVVEIRVQQANSTQADLDLSAFIEATVPLLCDADGGGVSISCPTMLSMEQMVIGSGKTAYAVTYQQEEQIFIPEDIVETSERMFYVVQTNEDPLTVVIVYSIGDQNNDMARVVAKSIQLVE